MSAFADVLHARLVELVTREGLVRSIRTSLNTYGASWTFGITQTGLAAHSRGQTESPDSSTSVTFTRDPRRMKDTCLRLMTAVSDACLTRNHAQLLKALLQAKGQEDGDFTEDNSDYSPVFLAMVPQIIRFCKSQGAKLTALEHSNQDPGNKAKHLA